MAVKNIDGDVYLIGASSDINLYKVVADFCNRMFPISKDLGNQLEKLKDDDYFLGIYRTAHDNYSDVFDVGLENLSLFKVSCNSFSDVDKNISFCDSMLRFIYELKFSVNFSNCVGVYIIKIPKRCIDAELYSKYGIIKPTDCSNLLLSKYICGFIPIGRDKLDVFFPNDQFQKDVGRRK